MDISAFNNKAAKSFNQQKALIKRILSGKSAQCPECNAQLQVSPQANGFKVNCTKGCTDIELEANSLK